MAASYCRGARSGLAKQNNQGGAFDSEPSRPVAVAPSRRRAERTLWTRRLLSSSSSRRLGR